MNLFLLAERSRVESLGDAFRSRPDSSDRNEVLLGFLILAAIAGGIWLLSRWLVLQDRRRSYNSPLRLFLALCRAHRLRWPDRWLLWRLARSQHLKAPARLFLERDRFEETKLSQPLRARAARLREIRDRLFAEPDKPQDPPVKKTKKPEIAKPKAVLRPALPAPTLDIPPWSPTEVQSTLPELH